MLPQPTVPTSLATLLTAVRPCFTAPSYRTFCQLACGLIAGGGRRTVTGMLTGAGLARVWHHSRAYHLFAYARWSPDRLGLTLLQVVVERLVPAGRPIELVIDDTLFRRRGRRVHAAYWTHDGAAADPRKIGYGNRWVICCVLVRLPFLSRPVALPVLFRLWRGKGTTTPVQLAVELVELVAAALPDRCIDVVADAAYSSPALRALPERVSWTLRLRKNARLDELAPPRTGRRGRLRLRGHRLGTPHRPRQHRGLHQCRGAPLRRSLPARRWRCDLPVVRAVAHPHLPGRAGPRTGHRQRLRPRPAHHRPDQPARGDRGALRGSWSIEVAIFDAKQVTGAGQARNRLRSSVERTVPFALLVQTLVVLWYTDHGDPAGDLDAVHAAAPWYTTKAEPSYADMHTSLRKTIIAARLSPATAIAPTDTEIRAVLNAWAAAEPALTA